VTAGSYGYAPRGVPHGFDNTSGRSAKILAWQTPAWGADRFIEALAALPPGAPDMEKLMELFRQYDFEPA
jgi:hypothetical protein